MLQSAIAEATETTILRDEYASVPFGGAKRLGGRIFGWMGEPLDGLEPPLLRAEAEHKEMVALFATPPSQAELREIDSSLHTGTLAIDTLTPIGRGQSMMLFGEAGTGKSAIGVDAILSQATSDVHCVLALSDGGAKRGREVLGALDAPLASRCTIISATRNTPAERFMCLAAAMSVGEAVRDGGGHAVVIADELSGMSELWNTAAEAAHAFGGLRPGAAADNQASAEQRIFYASYLQRASQMSDEKGGGSVTLLGLLRQVAAPDAVAVGSDGRAGNGAATVPSGNSTSSGGADDAPHTYTLADFVDRPEAERARIAALLARGITLDALTLARIRIRAPPPPVPAPATAAPSAGAAVGVASVPLTPPPSAEAEARRRSVGHIDQLMSLADGHVLLQRRLFALGRRPAMQPSEAIARVGAGSQQSERRARPNSAAMQRVAQFLRLELAQAHDLLPPDAADPPSVRQQRVRASAAEALLCAQPRAAPLRLSHELVVLHALLSGRLDHLAGAAPGEVQAETARLIAHAEAAEGDGGGRLLRRIDETGELDEEGEVRLLALVAEVLPTASGRAFFTNYDKTTWRDR